MVYVPPLCTMVNFNISGNYFPPTCDIINFSFGITGDVEIRSSNSEIILSSDTMNFFSGMMILPAKATIQVTSEKSLLDILIPITIHDSSVKINSELIDIEVLPDMIIENSTINIQCSESQVRSTQAFHLPYKIAGGGRILRWFEGSQVNAKKTFPAGPGDFIKDDIRNPVVGFDNVDNKIDSDWISLGAKDNIIVSISGDFYEHLDVSRNPSWISMYVVDNDFEVPWGSGFVSTDIMEHMRYKEPGAKDVLKASGWDIALDFDWKISQIWNEPGGKDISQTAAWGPFSYYTLCNNLKYYQPKGCEISFSFPNKYPLVPNVCEGIHFHVNEYSTNPRCPWKHWHTGTRDSGSGIIPFNPDQISYPFSKEIYYMLNSVLVEEVISHTPIEVLHVDAKIDRNSWLWSFSVTIADKCYLDLIKPVNGVMGHIKINMNGYIWLCTVEGWSENRSFGTQAWTITGRSPSMMFGDPVSQRASGVVSDSQQGQNIIESIVSAKQKPNDWPLDFANWSADFSKYNIASDLPGNVVTGFKPYSDWYIPGNTITYSDKTEIDIIKDLVGGIGAYIQTEPDQNKLTIKPMFAHQPWNWNTDNANIDWITMNESQLTEIGRSNESRPIYHAIHVFGESIGGANDGSGVDLSNTSIAVEVRRNEYGSGDANTKYSPMITNPYVTSAKAGLENGRMVIGKSGEWIKHTLRVGALCPSGGTSFGLFKTGDMISVMERGVAWNGQVTGVAVMSVNAGAGFAIEQVLEVEEYGGV